MQPSGCTPLLKTGGGNTKRQLSSRKLCSFGRYPLDFFTNFPYSRAPASARHYQNGTRVSLFDSAEVHKSALSASREAMKMFATLKLHPNSTSSVGECFHSSYTKVGGGRRSQANPTWGSLVQGGEVKVLAPHQKDLPSFPADVEAFLSFLFLPAASTPPLHLLSSVLDLLTKLPLEEG